MPGYEALPEAQRHAKAAAIFPTIRGLASTDRPQVGHYTDSDVVLEFLAREKLGPLAELGTSCPDHFLRTKVKPLVVDLPADAPIEDVIGRLTELHQAYYGCFQGTPWQWFVILCNGDVTHCCYDYDGTQKLGNVREQRITEIARSSFLGTIEEGFRDHDFEKLPRCAVCFKNPAAKPPLTDRIWKYAQAFPIKLPFRRLLNVPPGEG